MASITACLVLIATSITIPSAAASTIPIGQGGTLPSAAATNKVASVVAAPTVPLRLVDSGSGVNVTVRPPMAIPTKPAAVTEVASLRTERSQTFANPNGSFTLVDSATRLNYQDQNGAWQMIDPTLVPAAEGSGWDSTEKANDKTVLISNSHPGTGLAQLAVGPYSLTVRIPSADASTVGVPATSTVQFADPAGSFAVIPTTEGIDVSWSVAGATSPGSYSMAVNMGGLVASLAADKQSVTLTDPAAADPTAVVGTISPPTLYDSAGAVAPASATTVSLSTDAPDLQPGETLVSYAIDPAWLAEEGRSFPVTLDPTLCLQYGSSGCSTSGMTNPVDKTVTSGSEAHSLFWFPMFQLADGAVITSSTLTLEKSQGDIGQTVHALPTRRASPRARPGLPSRRRPPPHRARRPPPARASARWSWTSRTSPGPGTTAAPAGWPTTA